jgi:hypothetical protein
VINLVSDESKKMIKEIISEIFGNILKTPRAIESSYEVTTSEMGEDEFHLKLYDTYFREELDFFNTYLSNVRFFALLTAGVIALTGAGILQIRLVGGQTFNLLLIGALASVALPIIGIYSSTKLYERVLVIASMRAKIEEKLGLARKGEWNTPWKNEALVHERRLKNLEKYSSSVEFVDKNKYTGHNLWATFLFALYLISGFVLLSAL